MITRRGPDAVGICHEKSVGCVRKPRCSADNGSAGGGTLSRECRLSDHQPSGLPGDKIRSQASRRAEKEKKDTRPLRVHSRIPWTRCFVIEVFASAETSSC